LWHKEGAIMPERKRVCFLLHVKKDRLAKYKERHKSVWPEMRQVLRESALDTRLPSRRPVYTFS
jgi:hypothetical protein